MFSFLQKKLTPMINPADNDIKTTRYTYAEDQRKYIEEQLAQFKHSLNQLKELDTKIMLGVGADALLWLSGFLNTGLSAVGYAALYLYANQYANRSALFSQFEKQRDEMVEIYRWCGKNNSARVTYDKTFLSVLEAIAPFVTSKELLLWEIRYSNPNDISDRFAEILSDSPHQIPLSLFSKKELVNNNADSPPQRNKAGWHRFFDQSVSELKLAAYGQQPMVENQRQLKPN